MENIKNLNISDLRNGLLEGDFSSEEITKEYLNSISESNDGINALLETFTKSALEDARLVDKKIKNGDDLGPLAGVPIAFKDNMLIEGKICSSASKILSNYTAAYDATVTQKIKTADGVIIGRANMDEFAMGSSTENSAYGPVRNPWDYDRVAGGSSGGSAATVAANMSLVSLGSDTGGSIRLPAAFCGVVGMKPTYGRVSRFGLTAMASSLDQIGPFAKTVEDAEIVYNAIKGKDRYDATSSDRPESSLDFSNITIGLPKEYFVEGLDKETEGAVYSVIDDLKSKGIKFKEITLPHSKYALSTYYIVMFAEVATNLARFDGIRYSRNITDAKNLLDLYLKNRGEGFGEETKRRVLMGTFVLSSGYYDAYYTKAQKVRALIKKDFDDVFRDVDLILAPTSPTLPFKFGDRVDDPMAMYLSDILTIPVNLAGLPAISIPVKGRIDKLPVGFQLIGKPWHDSDLFEMGKFYEKM